MACTCLDVEVQIHSIKLTSTNTDPNRVKYVNSPATTVFSVQVRAACNSQ